MIWHYGTVCDRMCHGKTNRNLQIIFEISYFIWTKQRKLLYNNSVNEVYVVLGIIYMETLPQVGSPALNRNYPKKKEPFYGRRRSLIKRGRFFYINSFLLHMLF